MIYCRMNRTPKGLAAGDYARKARHEVFMLLGVDLSPGRPGAEPGMTADRGT
jgi:hypothetical protein